MTWIDGPNDLDTAALNQLARRRESQTLEAGFGLACAAAFELMRWAKVEDSPAGVRQWCPPGFDGIIATLRPENGGAIDVRGASLNERFLTVWALYGRMMALAFLGCGRVPEPSQENRNLAARVLAFSAGVFDEALIAGLQDNPDALAPLFPSATQRFLEQISC